MKRFNTVCLVIIAILLTSCGQRPADVIVIDLKPGSSASEVVVEDASKRHLKVAVSAILSPKETYESYEKIFRYISERIDIPVEFHQRKTYAEVNEMLESGQLDFAFICSGAYVDLKPGSGVELLAVPVSGGKPVYKAYIIVPESSTAYSLDDLRNSKFAFTDPMSNTGFLYVRYLLHEIGEHADDFFESTLFTYGHDISIQMVARGIVDGATVDHLVFEYLREKQPHRVQDVRIIKVSEEFGIPPVVSSSRLEQNLKNQIKSILLEMHEDESVNRLIHDLLIDKFIEGDDSSYHSIRKMRETVDDD